MPAQGVDFLADVHGDEELPYNFIAGLFLGLWFLWMLQSLQLPCSVQRLVLYLLLCG